MDSEALTPMTGNKWKEIWKKKGDIRIDGPLDLEQLLYIDGYDSCSKKLPVESWPEYINLIKEKILFEKGRSVFELGCGAGAFLYPFYEEARVGGLDYSASLIDIARKVMPEGSFVVDEACNLAVVPEYDYVISGGVFHYFPSYDYARTVLEKMLTKAKVAVAVLDVPDLNLKNDSEIARREGIPAEEYRARYQGLDHLYYPKELFASIAEMRGFKIEIFGQDLKGYVNSDYRYNVLFFKS